MAKTDFSSSSPLAGSFLTDHIHPGRRNALLRCAVLYIFICVIMTKSLLCGCFTLRDGFSSSAIFALIDGYDNKAIMS
ncbi:MAG TPA: hypothetical protein ENJ08_13100 [Gammaproteobacteria bacterium]|nr:hypothetical protein [Gammaproteobacteria bacterium]